ncbi:hypothetical protein [Nonomuraea sp. NPDC049695]|uniref:hypothetical protein n=1 Tax=Nonomuraea sp. NPDC049695 TaxID=3154734 RepID=UPI003427BFEF
MPSTGSTVASKKQEAEQDVFGRRTEPSGPRTDADALVNVPPEIVTEIRCPAFPGNDQVGFCPGPVVVSFTAAPPGVSVPVTSPSVSWAEIEPTAAPYGSASTVYVPVTGNVTVSNAHDGWQ